MPKKSIAIIGASNDRSKFGNKAVRAYVHRGWIVYPVNPKDETIEGLKTYKSILDVPQPVDRVSVYLPPAVGIKVLDDIAKVSAAEVFFNPGSDTPDVMEKAQSLKLNAVADCSIVAIGLSPSQFPSQ